MGSIRDFRMTENDWIWLSAGILLNVLILTCLFVRYYIIGHRNTEKMFAVGAKIYGKIFDYCFVVCAITWLPLMVVHNHFYNDDINAVLEPLIQQFVLLTVWFPLLTVPFQMVFKSLRGRGS